MQSVMMTIEETAIALIGEVGKGQEAMIEDGLQVLMVEAWRGRAPTTVVLPVHMPRPGRGEVLAMKKLKVLPMIETAGE